MSAEVYNKISEMLDFPNSKHLPGILEKMFTPEEGELLLGFAVNFGNPAQPEEIAERVGMDVEAVKNKLDDLKMRGVAWPTSAVWPGVEGWLFGPVFELLRAMYMTTFENFMSPEEQNEFMELLKEFYKDEWCEAQGKFYAVSPKLSMRVLPARQAFEHTPDIAPSKVLPDEDVKRFFDEAQSLAVTPCVCKVLWDTCDAPHEVCIKFNNWAEFTLSKNTGRRLTAEEALEISDRAEEAGLIHTFPLHATNTMCNCCSDCCIVIDPATKHGTMSTALYPSHYRSVINPDACIGCEDCVEKCPFDIIKMASSSEEAKAIVDTEKCYGCGVCVLVCPSDAITMKLVEQEG